MRQMLLVKLRLVEYTSKSQTTMEAIHTVWCYKNLYLRQNENNGMSHRFLALANLLKNLKINFVFLLKL